MMNKINIFNTLSQASQELAYFIQQLKKQYEHQNHILIALSGGSTPLQLFEYLKSCDLAYEKIHVFLVDERLVPLNDMQSNYHQVYETWLKWVRIPEENIHPVKVELAPESAALDYEQQIKHLFSGDEPPAFDIILLGLGEDGHIASLFPDQPVQASRLVQTAMAQYQGRPAGRVTFTPKLINAAKNIIFLVSGESKAPIVKIAIETSASDPGLPVSNVDPQKGSVYWFLDTAAASHLPSPTPSGSP